mgnify:CR=1 FL=1|jgi:uncharacterized protein (TIGR00290 family)
MSEPIVLAWSGGKDSALALAALQADDQFEVVSLMTTFTREFERVSMHGIQRDLIISQANRLGLPLVESWIDRGANNAGYEAAMKETLSELQLQGIQTVAFGDLFLEEIRTYRDQLVQSLDMKTLYPIWGLDTLLLAHHFVSDGFQAMTCCVDSAQIPDSFCGREFDTTFLQTLPKTADPCGENGEFHTFVYDSPMMTTPIKIKLGAVHRDGQFVFRELQSPVPNELTSSGETR